jgi:ribosomal protein L11 methyltransferase
MQGDPEEWGALSLEVPSGSEEEAAARVGAGSLGVAIEPAALGASRIRVYLPSVAQAEAGLEKARETLVGLGLDAGPGRLRVERVIDGRWVERYQRRLLPLQLGSGFEVLPDPAHRPGPGRIPLRLVPGRAFGTGEHPTTRMCAAALERRVEDGSRWLDLGCGSAILSMVAHHCGAARVLGLDNDPVAIEVAREVLAANELAQTVELAVGSERDAGPGEWNVVCNIAPTFFLEAADRLAARIPRAGWLIASGFLVEQEDEIVDRLASAGLEPTSRGHEAEWSVLTARRPAGG